jgi:hypothetical protein
MVICFAGGAPLAHGFRHAALNKFLSAWSRCTTLTRHRRKGPDNSRERLKLVIKSIA